MQWLMVPLFGNASRDSLSTLSHIDNPHILGCLKWYGNRDEVSILRSLALDIPLLE